MTRAFRMLEEIGMPSASDFALYDEHLRAVVKWLERRKQGLLPYSPQVAAKALVALGHEYQGEMCWSHRHCDLVYALAGVLVYGLTPKGECARIKRAWEALKDPFGEDQADANAYYWELLIWEAFRDAR